MSLAYCTNRPIFDGSLLSRSHRPWRVRPDVSKQVLTRGRARSLPLLHSPALHSEDHRHPPASASSSVSASASAYGRLHLPYPPPPVSLLSSRRAPWLLRQETLSHTHTLTLAQTYSQTPTRALAQSSTTRRSRGCRAHAMTDEAGRGGGGGPGGGGATVQLQVSTAEDAISVARRLDDELSNRPLDLDPAGYFLIFCDAERGEIVARHFKNVIDAGGTACDPDTGRPIPCDGSYRPKLNLEFRGRTAKELSVAIIETPPNAEKTITMLTHANYLGREFQKAEAALHSGTPYVQD
eukprot:jgi/Mesen1/2827/ME001732S01986